ncbi:MAG: DAK2 domain-containing protein [Anaerolineae bacterium]|nr:DAK2 domain-containing protein [Anaerolineae bacterium]
MSTRTNKHAAHKKKSCCDGQIFKELVRAGLAWLEQNHEKVNALNVFPVPDGDTGTNMLLTMRSAWKEIANSDDTHLGSMAQRVYDGALMGARGNSGVILSQLWRGFARGVEAYAKLDAETMAKGLEEATRTAYQAVQEPVEGTILTVAREASEEATLIASQTSDLREILEKVVQRCNDSVQHTPELLAVLREAGVVDSGGMGLAFIMEGMLRHLNGESLALQEPTESTLARHDTLAPHDELGYGYDVQFLLKGESLDVDQVRADIEAMGDSTLVVGDSAMLKVHVHVHNPGVPLGYGAEHGVLLDVVVENMQEQYQEFAAHDHGDHGIHDKTSIAPPQIAEGTIAAVTVAPGEGLTQIFYSVGAGRVISGGQTMNPSTEEIAKAINALPTNKVIMLPNNKNILLSAQQATQLTNSKQVSVVPTTSIPQGIAALLALDPNGELEEVAANMKAASEMVETGEITTATRNVTLEGIKIKKGQIIGLHNDILRVAGNNITEVVDSLLEKMGTADLELITLYYGTNVTRHEAQTLVEHLHGTYPDHDIELREGGQPHYFYIISAE